VVLKNRRARDPRRRASKRFTTRPSLASPREKSAPKTARGTFQSAKINLIEKTALRAWLRNRRSAVEVREPAKKKVLSAPLAPRVNEKPTTK
jgi:hypothetical protein